jgi:hypothetical protein
MTVNRNRFIPQLEECQQLLLPSIMISHVGLDHELHAERHVRTLPDRPVKFGSADHGAVSARNAAQVNAALKTKGLLTQHGPTGGGAANHVGPTLRVKSWANQAVQIGISHPTPHAVTALTEGWAKLTGPTTTGNPITVGTLLSPVPPPIGLAPIRGEIAHSNTGPKGPGFVPANQFGNEVHSSSDPLSRKVQERFEHTIAERQPGPNSSNHRAEIEAAQSAQQDRAEKKANLGAAADTDHSPLRPPSPDTNGGLRGTRITSSPDPIGGSETTSANAHSDPLQPTAKFRGTRTKFEFWKAIRMIRTLWRF